jgi:hypothetical protein
MAAVLLGLANRARAKIPKEGLPELIHDLTLFPPHPIAPYRLVPLFSARSTGNTVRAQRFCCRCVGCPAHITFVFDDVDQLSVSNSMFEHNHYLEGTPTKGARRATAHQRAHIAELHGMGMDAPQIRDQIETGSDVSVFRPPALYNMRHANDGEARSESQILLESLEDWTDFESDFGTQQGRFVYCYFFHRIFEQSDMARDTLFVDDAACTNRFRLPLVVILCRDDHSLSQLVAFAFIPNRTVGAFTAFFEWVRQRLLRDGDTDESAVPAAILLDRHPAQFAATDDTFDNTLAAFCYKHLSANIRTTMGPRSAVEQGFHMLNARKISDELFIAICEESIQNLAGQPTRKRFVRKLVQIIGHYSPARVLAVTPDRTTSRDEGWIGRLRYQLHHKIESLVNIVRAAVRLGRLAVSSHYDESELTFALSFDILSQEEQRRVGTFAIKMIMAELTKLQNAPPEGIGDCKFATCEAAHRWHLPCAHLLRDRKAANVDGHPRPLLSLKDIPDRWQSDPIWGRAGLTGARVSRTTITQPPDEWSRDDGRFYPNFLAKIEPFISDGHRLPGVRELCIGFVDQLHDLCRPPEPAPSGDDGSCQDPITIEVAGAQFRHPARASPLNPRRPKPKPKATGGRAELR